MKLKSLNRGLGTLRQAQCIAGDTSTSSVHRWGHFDKLSASLGTLRQAQCIAGDTSTSSVHRWGHFDKLSASLGTGGVATNDK
ncbi:MAG: hypothetical protein HEQ35_18520 [Gloeotrichia echinulata IR180]|nr:hypothetical protein [Gloeotrichia echinulata DEX184]